MSLDAQNIVGAIAPQSAITFFGVFPMSDNKVMEITKEGIWVNPDVSVDDTAKAVLYALDGYIKTLVKEVAHQEREACAKVAEEFGYDGLGCLHALQAAEAIRARGEK